MFEELMKNPEKYKVGDNYKATHLVFPVEFKEEKYIVKKLRGSWLASLTQKYYKFQESFFTNNKISSDPRLGFGEEARKLIELNGNYAPQFVSTNSDNSVIVREYLEGNDFRNLNSDDEILKVLNGSFEAIRYIHNNDIIVGDCHVKNTFLTEDQKVYWLDFDGVFNEKHLDNAKAQDLMKFIYSVYTVTRDSDKTTHTAKLIADNYDNKIVKYTLGDLVCHLESGFGLWFAKRINKETHNEIKKILKI